MKADTRKAVVLSLVGMLVVLAATSALAITGPQASDAGYSAYDILVNKIIKGVPGALAGVGLMLYAGSLASTHKFLPAIGTMAGGAFLLRADDALGIFGMIQ